MITLFILLLGFFESQKFSKVRRSSLVKLQDSNVAKACLPVTQAQMTKLGWSQTDSQISTLNKVLKKYNITTLPSLQHFLGQTSQESGCGYWSAEIADGSDYEGWTSLGNIYPGDGKKFKGAGYIGLTGRANYQKFADAIGDQKVMQGWTYVSEHYAWESAAWFWNWRGINDYCAKGDPDVYTVSVMVNGGTNGLDVRRQYTSLAQSIFTSSCGSYTPTYKFTYAVRYQGGGALGAVQDDSDYAGIRGKKITDIAIKATNGTVQYRVHVLGGDWLGWVSGYNWNDANNGYAGNGKPIDLVQVKASAYTPKYRVSPVSSDYYSWQSGVSTSNGQDGYAGAKGKAIDRFQLKA